MKFLVDAQLPGRLAAWLVGQGHEALHTRDLREGNRTSDAVICALSVRERSVVITKDEDFVDSFVLHGRPHKLLLITTGNINNRELERVFLNNLARIVSALRTHDFVELGRTSLICHS